MLKCQNKHKQPFKCRLVCHSQIKHTSMTWHSMTNILQLLVKKVNYWWVLSNQLRIIGGYGLIPVMFPSSSIVSMLTQATSKARVRRTGISPLHLAAERNRDNVLEFLIEAGFDVNQQLSKERSRLYEDRRSTALYFSVINNNIDAVRVLLAAGANPNLDMFRPLMVAARQGCIQTVKLLVENGADINACIPTHPTTFPAVYMFSMKYLPMFKYLLDHGGHALSCFDCVYGSQTHPPITTTRSERSDLPYTNTPDAQRRRGVQVSLL